MLESGPWESVEHLVAAAQQHFTTMHSHDWLEAFSGHPQIGNVESLRAKYASSKSMASGEQGLVPQASEEVLTDLAELNQAYLDKFGFIFIVFATGKSASQMLVLLQQRIKNNQETEMVNAAQQQAQITLLRIQKQIEPQSGEM